MKNILSYPDAHIHITDCAGWRSVGSSPVCACVHSPDEWDLLAGMLRFASSKIIAAYGIHPQKPDRNQLPFLEYLAKNGLIGAVGEAGFDLSGKGDTEFLIRQNEVWDAQIALAVRYGLPLVVHCRKGMGRIFASAKQLVRVPSVIFHSFPGSPAEARSLISRGINAYFSFGKSLLGGRKLSLHCVHELDLERLLAETDAPYQKLRDERLTYPEDIVKVYDRIALLRREGISVICRQLSFNFMKAFAPA